MLDNLLSQVGLVLGGVVLALILLVIVTIKNLIVIVPPNIAAMIEARVASARKRSGPSRSTTMRAPITTSTAIDPSRLPRVTLGRCHIAPTIPATASTTAATSMLRHGRAHQRFQASVQAATAGTHITLASQA